MSQPERIRSKAWSLLPVAALLVIVVGLAVSNRSGGAGAQIDRGATLPQVVAEPERYVNRQVVLTGVVDERLAAVPDTDEGALLVRGPQGGRLYVVPRRPAMSEGLAPGDSVEVRGTVRRVDTVAADQRPGAPPTREDVFAATGAAAMLLAVTMEERDGVDR